jgi:cell division protein YceG involved in septum cleavage
MEAIYIIFIVVIILIILYLIFVSFKGNKYLTKNHDHLKIKHSSKEKAISAMNKLKQKNIQGSERLQVYYNPNLKGWFVGKSSW